MEHQVFGRLCPINFRACPLKLLITVRNEVAKVMFLQACVYPHGGGVSTSVHAGIPHPQKQTPPEQTPCRSRHPPVADNPPGADIPRRDGHCCGRYASYCSVFLFILYFLLASMSSVFWRATQFCKRSTPQNLSQPMQWWIQDFPDHRANPK